MLGNTEASEDKATNVTRLPRWRKVEPLAKSFLGNTLHILGEILFSRFRGCCRAELSGNSVRQVSCQMTPSSSLGARLWR